MRRFITALPHPVTVALALALLAQATPAAAQLFPGQQPRQQTGTPEEANQCPIPTLEECQAEGYLTEDPCGILQAQNEWTCAALLEQALEDDPTPRQLSIIAYNIEPLGIDPEVLKLGADPIVEQGLYYTPDLYAITSQAAAKNFLPAQQVEGVDIYATWDNSTAVNSCTEYVYEKFYDQTLFERKAGLDQHDYRKIYQLAYGAGYKDESIGTRHLSDAMLRGFDNRGYAPMFTGASRPKNAFFALPMFASLPGRPPVEGAPSLALSLYGYNLFSMILVALLPSNYGTVDASWAWHKEMSESLSVEGAPLPGLTLGSFGGGPVSPIGYAAPQPEEPDQLAELTGEVPDDVADGKPLRRYLDAELNELYDKQIRLRQLIREWARADVKFAGSGWTVGELHESPPPDDEPTVGGLFLAQPMFFDPSPQFTTLPTNPTQPPTIPPVIKNPGPTEETMVRTRILEEILELYFEVAEYGCLASGLTPCDWSPKLFARAVLHRYSGLRDDAFARCDEYVPAGDFTPIKNLNIPVVDEPPASPLAAYNCTIATGSTITAFGLEQLFAKVDECRQKHADYLVAKAELEAQMALEAAIARVEAIPELIDPATGEVRPPGIGDGRSESKGNNYFGLAYDWGYGFAADYEANTCSVQVFAGGHFFLDATVLTQNIEIVDALAELSTDDQSVDIHARLLGINLFTPIEQSLDFAAADQIDFGTTRESENGDDPLAVAAVTIFIGPIPLQLQAGISGTTGLDFDYGGFVQGFGLGGTGESNCPKAGVHAYAYPRVHLTGFAQASIPLGIAEAGVRGELLIVNAETRFDASLGLAFDPSNDLDLTFPKNLKLEVGTSLTAAASTLEGNVTVYGRLGICPLCSKAEKTLVAWDGYAYDKTFFDQTYSVYLGDLLDAANN